MSFVHRRTSFFVGVIFVIAITVVWMTIPLNAASVIPTVVDGNPDCSSLGYDFGYKPQPEPPPTGVYNFPDSGDVVSLLSDGTYFDWSTSLGVDTVIVKGGPNANVYTYAPEAFDDTGLNAPINSSNSMPYSISHIEFCYDYEVTVEKTVNTRFEQSYDWWITKDVVQWDWHFFVGDTGDSYYTITATAEPVNTYFVNGAITVTNLTPFPASVTGVADLMTNYGTVALSCIDQLGYPVPFASDGVFGSSVTLGPGDILTCTFPDIQLGDGTSRINTATATTTGIVGGDSAAVDVIFNTQPDVVTDAVINVDDDNTSSNPDWVFDATNPSETFTRTYTKQFACADETNYSHKNTVTILGDADHPEGNSDDATVTVNCYALAVSKTVVPSYVRDYDWSISKSASFTMSDGTVIDPVTNLVLAYGQQGPIMVDYTVALDLAIEESYGASGIITIANPNPLWGAPVQNVQDYVIAEGVLPKVDAVVSNCSLVPFDGVYWIPSGASMTCEYELPNLSDDSTRTNFAVASLLNWDYVSSDGGYTISRGNQIGITNFDNSPGMPITFGLPTAEYDECVEVYDVRFINTQQIMTSMGSICAIPTTNSGRAVTIQYSMDISQQLDTWLCEPQIARNSAGFTTINDDDEGMDDPDDDEVGIDNWDILVDIACDYGCTLTQGYWKTHSALGPAPYDDDWANLADADGDLLAEEHMETFFLSGQSYLEVLLTPPSGGNAYYMLAHQYIAAKLNVLAGTSAPQAVLDALAEAETLFAANTPDDVASLKGKQRKDWLSLATLLDDYNNGLLGPAHCSE